MRPRGSKGWKSWLEGVLGFFYPPVCQLCQGEPARADRGYVGRHCGRSVRWIEPPFCERCGLPFAGAITEAFECANCRDMRLHFRYARAAVVAQGPVREAIHRYKYQRALWFERFLAGLLTRAAAPELGCGRWDMIVPVPLHPFKRREREFNQAERLAMRLGKSTGLPIRLDVLRRDRHTDTQTRLTRVERERNMSGAFSVSARVELQGARVVVVDDVLTTGATTNACAEVLMEQGAGSVCVWTVARGL
jgi:ComF family protein